MTFHRDMFRIMRSASISALTLALWFALTLVPKKALAEDISNSSAMTNIFTCKRVASSGLDHERYCEFTAEHGIT